ESSAAVAVLPAPGSSIHTLRYEEANLTDSSALVHTNSLVAAVVWSAPSTKIHGLEGFLPRYGLHSVGVIWICCKTWEASCWIYQTRLENISGWSASATTRRNDKTTTTLAATARLQTTSQIEVYFINQMSPYPLQK